MSAQAEEDQLANELEIEQVAALEAADEEELSYLKAIEREESTEIDEEIIDAESLMVSTI